MITCPECDEAMSMRYQIQLTDLGTDRTGLHNVYHHSIHHSQCRHHVFVAIEIVNYLPRLTLSRPITTEHRPW